MLTIKKLDIALSIKLGDPANDNGDGGIFDFALRLGYLQRAISKLYRDLPLLMSTYAPLFSRNNTYHTQIIATKKDIEIGAGDFIATGDSFIIGTRDEETDQIKQKPLEEIQEVFVKVVKNNSRYSTEKATFVKSEKYLSMIHEGADGYEPSFEDKNIYYTILEDKIHLIPLVTNTYEYSEISLIMKSEPSELTLESTLPISTDYEDLILSMAALEGMQDLARNDKVSIYANEVNGQLKVLQGYAAYKIQKEGSDVKNG